MKKGINNLRAGFVYTLEALDAEGNVISRREVKNIMPTAALDYAVNAFLKAGSQYSSWYVGLFSANRTPIAADTMVTLMADCSEITAYSGSTRPAVTLSTVSGGATNNTASPTVFTFTSAVTVQGIIITSNPTRGNDSGLLLSGQKISSPETFGVGGSYRVLVGMALVSA